LISPLLVHFEDQIDRTGHRERSGEERGDYTGVTGRKKAEAREDYDERKDQDHHERPLDTAADLLEYRPARRSDGAADLQCRRLKPALGLGLGGKIEKLMLDCLNSVAATNSPGVTLVLSSGQIWPILAAKICLADHEHPEFPLHIQPLCDQVGRLARRCFSLSFSSSELLEGASSRPSTSAASVAILAIATFMTRRGSNDPWVESSQGTSQTMRHQTRMRTQSLL
jgi:hypothetical protein